MPATGWWRTLTQSPIVRVTHCAPDSMVCSALLPLCWISTGALCGIISEASHLVELHSRPRVEAVTTFTVGTDSANSHSHSMAFETLSAFSLAGSFRSTCDDRTLIRVTAPCAPAPLPQSVTFWQKHASKCLNLHGQGSPDLLLVSHGHQKQRHRRWEGAPESDYTERGKGSSIAPLFLGEPEGRPSVHTQHRTTCRLRDESPSLHPRRPAATSEIFNVHASFVQRRVNQADSMCKLNLSCVSYCIFSLSARLPVWRVGLCPRVGAWLARSTLLAWILPVGNHCPFRTRYISTYLGGQQRVSVDF